MINRRLTTILLGVFTYLFIGTVDAQQWKYYRHQFGGGLSATSFLGELGGSKDVGSRIKDVDIRATRPNLYGEYAYQFHEQMQAVAQFGFGMLSGDDALSGEPIRHDRNLHFRSVLVEFSANYRFYFIKEKYGSVFKLRGAHNNFFSNISAYATVGIGGAYFNPKAKYNGSWVALQPLGTEGQGIVPGRTPYSRVTLIIPGAIGAKYSLGRKWSISMEYSIRKTFTDYMDDVSTTYVSDALLRTQNGDMAADLANPAETKSWFGAGEQRGNPDQMDYYMMVTVSAHYKLLKGQGFRPRF